MILLLRRNWNWRPCHSWLQGLVLQGHLNVNGAPKGPQEQSISQTMVQHWRFLLCLVLHRKHQSCLMYVNNLCSMHLPSSFVPSSTAKESVDAPSWTYTVYKIQNFMNNNNNNNKKKTSEKNNKNKKTFHEWPVLLRLHCYLPTHHCPWYVSQTLLDPSAAFF